jgi:hypothetical protein
LRFDYWLLAARHLANTSESEKISTSCVPKKSIMSPPKFAVYCVLLTICHVSLLRAADAAKILLVPANINSHVMYFARLGETLTELGHHCHLLAASNARLSADVAAAAAATSGRFSIGRYEVDGDMAFVNSPEFSKGMVDIALGESTLAKLRMIMSFWGHMQKTFAADCERLLDNSSVVDHVRSSDYDFAIMDPAFPQCFVLPYALRLPYAALSVPIGTFAYRVPRLPSFASSFGHSDRMSFGERLSCFLQDLMITHVVVPPPNTTLSVRHATDRPPLDVYDIVARSSFWLYLEDLAIGYPLPLMPNTIPVGDLMAGRPGGPLPPDLERFVEASRTEDGVVIVSFGSYLDDVPASVTRQFCEALRQLRRGLRVVWKLRDASLCVDDRIRTLPWIPQNDLLADSRVRLFVTHGGLNSIVESVYHAKPVVVVPISLDQPANAAMAEHKGFGIRVELSDPDFPVKLAASVHRIVDDPSYTGHVQLLSKILRDKPNTAAERTSFMIDHVLKYGDAHLRTGAFDLSIAQFIMFDIFAFIVLLAAVVISVGVLIGWLILKACIRRYLGGGQPKAKSD